LDALSLERFDGLSMVARVKASTWVAVMSNQGDVLPRLSCTPRRVKSGQRRSDAGRHSLQTSWDVD
jgi:hypothetical protein